MTITIDIAPEIETRMRAEAAQNGQEVNSFLNRLVQERFTAPVMTEQGRASWKALFDALKEGDTEEQRETLTMLKEAVDADRPGQRSVFGTGVNPDI